MHMARGICLRNLLLCLVALAEHVSCLKESKAHLLDSRSQSDRRYVGFSQQETEPQTHQYQFRRASAPGAKPGPGGAHPGRTSTSKGPHGESSSVRPVYGPGIYQSAEMMKKQQPFQLSSNIASSGSVSKFKPGPKIASAGPVVAIFNDQSAHEAGKVSQRPAKYLPSGGQSHSKGGYKPQEPKQLPAAPYRPARPTQQKISSTAAAVKPLLIPGGSWGQLEPNIHMATSATVRGRKVPLRRPGDKRSPPLFTTSHKLASSPQSRSHPLVLRVPSGQRLALVADHPARKVVQKAGRRAVPTKIHHIPKSYGGSPIRRLTEGQSEAKPTGRPRGTSTTVSPLQQQTLQQHRPARPAKGPAVHPHSQWIMVKG